jgi:putative SOS response-associated peptidase YedK
MCGRFTQTKDLQTLEIRFGFSAPDSPFKPRYNVAPMQNAPVVMLDSGQRLLRMMRWGLVPYWAKDESIAAKLINARAETITEKPSFSQAFAKRRCLVLADGFYEWSKQDGKKTPHYFYLRGGQPFAIAGIFDHRCTIKNEDLYTFTIITTAANDLLQGIHERMPVILGPDAEAIWLDPATSLEQLLMLLKPYDPWCMAAHEVSPQVNSPKHDNPDCIAPQPG